jgi:phosphoesterase RecJ-like protein
MMLRHGDFHETGATPDETENLINEALRLETVEAVMLLVENDDAVRVSLRSRSVVDVAALARQFGGGGHARAAGLRAAEPIDALRDRLVAAVEEALRHAGLT